MDILHLAAPCRNLPVTFTLAGSTVRRRKIILLCCLVLAGSLARAEDWKFGGFRIPALPGYVYERGEKPSFFRGPAGWASIGVYEIDRDYDEPKRRELVARAIGMSRGVFRDAQVKFRGIQVRPVSEEKLPDGGTLVWLASDIAGPAGPGHLLQYNFISRRGDVATLVLEGEGGALQVHEKYSSEILAGRWHAR